MIFKPWRRQKCNIIHTEKICVRF